MREVRGQIPEISESAVEDCILGKAAILEQQMKDQAWSPLAARINGWRQATAQCCAAEAAWSFARLRVRKIQLV